MNTNTIQHYLSADGIRLTVADTSNVSLEAEAIDRKSTRLNSSH